MLSWPPTVKIYLGAEPTDMRKGFDSLAYLVESSMALDPFSGHLFVFRSRRGDRTKILIGMPTDMSFGTNGSKKGASGSRPPRPRRPVISRSRRRT